MYVTLVFLSHTTQYCNFVALITKKQTNKKCTVQISEDHSCFFFSFAACSNIAQFLMAAEQHQNGNSTTSQNNEELQKKVDEFLTDPATRTALLEKLAPQLMAHNTGTHDKAVPFSYPTLSGMSAGSRWPVFPVPFPLGPAPGFPPFWGQHADTAGEQSTPHANN